MVSEGWKTKAPSRGLKGPSRRSKFGNRITFVGEERFDSVAEAEYSKFLHLRELAGEITQYRRQVRLPVGAGIIYVADFMVWPKGILQSEWYVVDVKGVLTKEFKLKAKLFCAGYPFNKLIIAKAIYRGGVITGFEETEFGTKR